MTAPVALTQRLFISAQAIAWFVLAVFFIIGLPVVLVWPKYVFGIVVALALMLVAPVFLVRRFWARQHEGYSSGRVLQRLLELGKQNWNIARCAISSSTSGA